MDRETIKDMMDKYRDGTASEAEIALLESWYLQYQPDGEVDLSMNERVEAVDRVWAKLQPARKVYMWPRIAAAAAVLLVMATGAWFLWKPQPQKQTETVTQDVAPGKNNATLTLANGRKIKLSDVAEGQIAEEAGIVIRKGANGAITYIVKPAAVKPEGPQFNVMETFRGEQHQLILPDGSHIWLNASSSIKYPVSFAGKERAVELQGEAYFEIAPDKARPFKVQARGQHVEVLGTHFNINAYNNEPAVKTTLLEGAVKVSTTQHVQILKPGEQAVLTGDQLRVAVADTEEAVAWKNGYFMFQSENIYSIMRKIERWYNVEAVFEGEIPADNFSGSVNRFANVSQVLRKLELTNKVHFKISGNKIIVTK